MKETSLVIIKQDGVERKLVGKIIKRFEDKGID
nr:nucleoside-diphosphate kinase [Staphylococcus haemolyticus]